MSKTQSEESRMFMNFIILLLFQKECYTIYYIKVYKTFRHILL